MRRFDGDHSRRGALGRPHPERRPGGGQPAPRLASLDGVRLGLLANGKTHGDRLLDLIVEDLATRHRIGEVVRVRKAHPSQPPSTEQVAMLAEQAMAILSAIGD